VTDVLMPRLGETVTGGTITRWLKAPGELVQVGEPLFEVSTDKVDSEVPAVAGGQLLTVCVAEGETVDVGTVVAVLGSVDDDTPAPPAPPPAPPVAAAAPPVAPAAPPVAAVAPPAAPPVATPATPAAPAVPASVAGDRLLSPRVRALLDLHQVEPTQVPATGGRGRLTIDDATRFVGTAVPPAARRAVPAPAPAPVSTAGPVGAPRSTASTASMASTAWVSLDVDFTEVERARDAAKAAFLAREGIPLTALPFVARAVVDALRELPVLNAGTGVDLGVAGTHGQVVAVAVEAQGKRLRALARELTGDSGGHHDGRARSTFTVADLGAHGVRDAIAVLDPPDVAVLSLGTVERRCVVGRMADGAETLTIRSIGTLGLAWGNHGVDAGSAAAFLGRVKAILETREWIAELS
jgi:pyruvate dehydrogenase E2 component (dihydrolipoamide acetyltransferase)